MAQGDTVCHTDTSIVHSAMSVLSHIYYRVLEVLDEDIIGGWSREAGCQKLEDYSGMSEQHPCAKLSFYTNTKSTSDSAAALSGRLLSSMVEADWTIKHHLNAFSTNLSKRY